MDTRDSARDVLRDAEAALRHLMEEAIGEQRYVDVAEVARLAEGVARLIGSPLPIKSASPIESQVSAKIPVVPVAQAKKQEKPSRTKIRKKMKYPRFERDGNRLVKVGWSKKHRKEYEHRAPRDSVAAFIRHLTASVPEGQVFIVDELMPVPGLVSGDEIPAYQVYLTLKWLQDRRLVQKRGRDGYVLHSSELATSGIDVLWKAVPERKHRKD